jgi:retron-type reverse transcriptase
MKRWDADQMLEIGKKLFAKIHKQKKHANHNHDAHFMAREIDEWLPQGIQAMINGTYDPRCLKRHYFPDEVVDQLHLTDRIFQHILLQQLKPTFKHVMSKNVYHLCGPAGVKHATQRIRQVLQDGSPRYVIRADVKSFYKSIPHYKLVQDIKQYYSDPRVQAMLINIIKNPIETSRGYKNADSGIALRGPLSQFFSGLYLKPLDDALSKMEVTYLRYQDDILILCHTKRQLNRAWRKMLDIFNERRLSLSHKKTRRGEVSSGFHFLGVCYAPTQPESNTTVMPVNDAVMVPTQIDQDLCYWGGVK